MAYTVRGGGPTVCTQSNTERTSDALSRARRDLLRRPYPLPSDGMLGEAKLGVVENEAVVEKGEGRERDQQQKGNCRNREKNILMVALVGQAIVVPMRVTVVDCGRQHCKPYVLLHSYCPLRRDIFSLLMGRRKSRVCRFRSVLTHSKCGGSSTGLSLLPHQASWEYSVIKRPT